MPIDVTHDPSAQRARKRPTPVQTRFADEAGILQTLEGPVRYEAGAALLTGEAGERWPVERTTFDATYEPLPGTAAGLDGRYQKRPLVVWVCRLREPASVIAGYADDPLQGQPGDWLVQYGPGNFGIVAAAVFDATYDLLGPMDDASPEAPQGQSR